MDEFDSVFFLVCHVPHHDLSSKGASRKQQIIHLIILHAVSQLAPLALLNITHWKSILLLCSKTQEVVQWKRKALFLNYSAEESAIGQYFTEENLTSPTPTCSGCKTVIWRVGRSSANLNSSNLIKHLKTKSMTKPLSHPYETVRELTSCRLKHVQAVRFTADLDAAFYHSLLSGWSQWL